MVFLTLFQIITGMIESVNKLRELEQKLSSKNRKVISDAIISLRNADPLRGTIGLLACSFDKSNDLTIKDLIRNIMNDIKEPGARIELVAEIKKSFKPETICMLVSSCWQSGLDYSGYATDFTDIFINGDYLTSLECFTVIEESAHDISVSLKKEITRRLKLSKKTSSSDKIILTEALIAVLC
jgi:hypothetical protein